MFYTNQDMYIVIINTFSTAYTQFMRTQRSVEYATLQKKWRMSNHYSGKKSAVTNNSCSAILQLLFKISVLYLQVKCLYVPLYERGRELPVKINNSSRSANGPAHTQRSDSLFSSTNVSDFSAEVSSSAVPRDSFPVLHWSNDEISIPAVFTL